MLATITLATAVLGGHTQPSEMYMFAAVFPAEAQLIANELRTVEESFAPDEPDAEGVIWIVPAAGFTCIVAAGVCGNDVYGLVAGCQDQCAATWCPGALPGWENGSCADADALAAAEACAECCTDQGTTDMWTCLACASHYSDPARYGHCYATRPAPNPPPFDEEPIVPRLITGDLTDPEVP